MPSRNVLKVDVPDAYYHIYARGTKTVESQFYLHECTSPVDVASIQLLNEQTVRLILDQDASSMGCTGLSFIGPAISAKPQVVNQNGLGLLSFYNRPF